MGNPPAFPVRKARRGPLYVGGGCLAYDEGNERVFGMVEAESSYAGDAQLEEALAAAGVAMPVAAVRDLVAGVAAAPDGYEDWTVLVAPNTDAALRGQLNALRAEIAAAADGMFPYGPAPAERLAALQAEIVRARTGRVHRAAYRRAPRRVRTDAGGTVALGYGIFGVGRGCGRPCRAGGGLRRWAIHASGARRSEYRNRLSPSPWRTNLPGIGSRRI